MSDRATLKAFFETGDFPTEAQFAAWLDSVPLPTKTTVDFTDFQPSAATNNTISLFTPVAGTIPTMVKLKHSTAFSGGALTNVVLTVFDGDGNTLLAGFDVFQAVGATVGGYASNYNFSSIPNQGAADDYEIRIDVAGGVINDLAAGVADVWVMELPLI